MKNNAPPEEKLLRLIKGQKRQDNIGADKELAIAPKKPESALKHSAYPLEQKFSSMLYIHRFILCAFIISCVYSAISFIYPLLGLKKIELPDISSKEGIDESKIEPAFEVKPYEFYLEGIKNRQIFATKYVQVSIPPAVIGANLDLVKDFILVGIVSGENKQAVIEDKKIQKTYYLTKGQSIGEFLVEDIIEGKVILNYKGQKFELYL